MPETLTGGIFYCRDSAEMKGCSSHQTSSWLGSDVLRNRQQKHTAKTLPARLKKEKTNKRLTIKIKSIRN